LPAAKTPAKKPGPKPGPKPAAAKNASKAKKPGAKALEEALHRARMLRAYCMGIATLVLLALAVIPGQSVWLGLHNGLWGFAGMLLLPWLAFSFYCCSLWMRNQSLLGSWLTLLFQALLLLFLGAAVFVIARPADVLEAEPFWPLASSSFERMGERWTAPELLGNGGLFGAMLGAGLARGCGKPGAAIVSLLLALAALPMALPPLQRALVGAVTGRWGADAPPRPEKAEREKPGRPERPAQGEAMDELEELDRIGREHGLRNPFRRKPVEIPVPEGRIPTVADIEPLPPADDAAAGEIADSLQPGGAKRRRAREAGEEASRAAMEALLRDAAAAGSGKSAQVYQAPPLSCLSAPRSAGAQPDKGEEDMIARKLVYTLESFGVAVELVGRSRGPAVTRYELRPAEGVKISKITSLADDIALRLAATKVRIEAPIPGKPAVGVEVPNRVRAIVSMRELVDSDTYRAGAAKSKLTVALGKDIVGDLVCADLAKLPHLLIAGTTGSGKSVCMNALILSLMFNASPEDVKLVMVDPKQVEFNVYSGIPHLLVPVVNDPLKAAGALGWAVNEMEKRYTTISEQNVRDIDSYNNIADMQKGDLKHLPRVVIFIDELSDLMMVAPSDVEDSIQRLAQKGRAAGMHLVVSTQRPSVDVITGVIKSNLPGRIALSVASQIDSRTIINSMGAEQLLGNGDMLFSMNGGNNAIRVQGCYVSDAEVRKVVSFVKEKDPSREGYDDGVWEEIDRFAAQAARGKKRGGGFDLSAEDDAGDDDPMLDAAIEVVVNAQLASTTMLQKKLKLGYARASRLVDLLEDRGVVGPPEGAKPRKVLMSHAQWQEYMAMAPDKRTFGSEEE
jgi:S-DNA-T family DNA segregation ATPase FtsK/SpoIIIE